MWEVGTVKCGGNMPNGKAAFSSLCFLVAEGGRCPPATVVEIWFHIIGFAHSKTKVEGWHSFSTLYIHTININIHTYTRRIGTTSLIISRSAERCTYKYRIASTHGHLVCRVPIRRSSNMLRSSLLPLLLISSIAPTSFGF